MPTFVYKARDQKGVLLQGEIRSSAESLAFKSLAESGLYVSSLKKKGKISWSGLFSLERKNKALDIIIFTRQLATMVEAGLPLNSSLGILADQLENKSLAKTISQVKENIEMGSSLAEALSKHPKFCDETYIAMVGAGEAGGFLAEVLGNLASLAEISLDRKTKVKSALTYPTILIIAALLGVSFLVILVFPLFVKIFAKANVSLPWPTRVLVEISSFLRRFWYILLPTIAGILFFFSKYYKTPSGRRKLDSLKLKIPIFGNLFRKVSMSSFVHTLRALNQSGIPIIKSLDIVSKVVKNKIIAEAILKARDRIEGGYTLNHALMDGGEFPEMVTQMVRVGEESGRVDEMLDKIAQYYDRDIDYTISRLTALLEPALILFMGFVVAFMYLSLIMPMLNLLKVARAGGLG